MCICQDITCNILTRYGRLVADTHYIGCQPLNALLSSVTIPLHLLHPNYNSMQLACYQNLLMEAIVELMSYNAMLLSLWVKSVTNYFQKNRIKATNYTLNTFVTTTLVVVFNLSSEYLFPAFDQTNLSSANKQIIALKGSMQKPFYMEQITLGCWSIWTTRNATIFKRIRPSELDLLLHRATQKSYANCSPEQTILLTEKKLSQFLDVANVSLCKDVVYSTGIIHPQVIANNKVHYTHRECRAS